ncbi:hypothetical protein [Priestia aryabhattai]|uniref:hypothetical protein n=1 Tax=Priestia aryabhattai TaxID=412384 RepID=UPI003D2C518C
MDNNINLINIPDAIPTSGQDWANHISRFYSSDTQLKVVLELEGKIDKDIMARAVRLSIDAEPVLGCEFVETEQDPFWKRFKNIDEMNWCLFEECKDKELALDRFFASTLFPHTRQLQTKIIRTEENDILCLTINHSCSDVAGVKEYLHILSNIYREICRNDEYLPIANKYTDRGMDRVFQSLGISDLRKAWSSKQEASKPTWVFPYCKANKETLKVALCKVSKDQFEKIILYCRKREVTINDFMMTVFYRTLFNFLKPETTEPLEVTITADLRRYLPDNSARTICNMSGKVNTKLSKVEEEAFSSTLKRISQIMKEIKNNNPGINSAIAMELLRNMGYKNVLSFFENTSKLLSKTGKSSPLFTNMGVVSKYPFKFGDTMVKNAYIVSPAGYPPNFTFGFSSYNNTLTMTVNYFEPTTCSKDVQNFFDLMTVELNSYL